MCAAVYRCVGSESGRRHGSGNDSERRKGIGNDGGSGKGIGNDGGSGTDGGTDDGETTTALPGDVWMTGRGLGRRLGLAFRQRERC